MHSLPQVYWTKSITTKDNDFLTSQPNTFWFGSKSPGGRGEAGWGGGLARPCTQGPVHAHRPSGSLSDSGSLLMMEKQCIEPGDPTPPPHKADLELKLGPSSIGAGVVGVSPLSRSCAQTPSPSPVIAEAVPGLRPAACCTCGAQTGVRQAVGRARSSARPDREIPGFKITGWSWHKEQTGWVSVEVAKRLQEV